MKEKYLTIQEASRLLNVSEATCRNWIRSNTIVTKKIDNKIFIIESSINELLDNNLNGRLSSRRNKTKKSGNILSLNYLSKKQSRDIVFTIIEKVGNIESFDKINYVLKLCALSQLKLANKYNADGIRLLNDLYDGDEYTMYNDISLTDLLLEDDILGALYMCLKQVSDRKSGGMYYTPAHIVNGMFDNIRSVYTNLEEKNIIDICCGTGNFLIKALDYGFIPKNIFGNDSDSVSVALTRINLFLRTNLTYEQLIEQVTCSDSLKKLFNKYDFCIGNPPWGSELSIPFSEVRNNFKVAESKSVDPFCLFIEKGMDITKENGCLYYVCPEALCNVGIHMPTRKYLQNNYKLLFLEYLGNAFDGVQTPAITICIKNEVTSNFAANSLIRTNNLTFKIREDRFADCELWDFNISTDYYDIVERICRKDNVRFLKDNAKFALGIVTGDNKKYVLTTKTPQSSNIVKGSNIYKYGIELGKYFLEYDREKFQQVAPDEYYFAREKLIYRFISDTLVFTYDDNQTLTLNSANICIPTFTDIPIKYVLAVLNSRLSHFIFKLKFNSIKVLRNHIESLPIVTPSSTQIDEVTNYVDQLLCTTNGSVKENIYNELDDLILNIYNLSDEEKNIVRHFNKNNIFLY